MASKIPSPTEDNITKTIIPLKYKENVYCSTLNIVRFPFSIKKKGIYIFYIRNMYHVIRS